MRTGMELLRMRGVVHDGCTSGQCATPPQQGPVDSPVQS